MNRVLQRESGVDEASQCVVEATTMLHKRDGGGSARWQGLPDPHDQFDLANELKLPSHAYARPTGGRRRFLQKVRSSFVRVIVVRHSLV